MLKQGVGPRRYLVRLGCFHSLVLGNLCLEADVEIAIRNYQNSIAIALPIENFVGGAKPSNLGD
jgi:hypothetical protein